jgi:phage shock protein C
MHKKFYRSKTDKILGGVCGGAAEYFGVDPWVVRIAWLLLITIAPLHGVPFLLYILAWVLAPVKPGAWDSSSPPDKPLTAPKMAVDPRNRSLFVGLIITLVGAAALVGTVAPKVPIQLLFATALIVLGLLVITGAFTNGGINMGERR